MLDLGGIFVSIPHKSFIFTHGIPISLKAIPDDFSLMF
jgi:hypothetical protein